jgi:hypothetical protein
LLLLLDLLLDQRLLGAKLLLTGRRVVLLGASISGITSIRLVRSILNE